jgi:heme-degrading monooxygenase HmoA
MARQRCVAVLQRGLDCIHRYVKGQLFMYSASFIFEPGQYDAEFHQLNERIDAVARSMQGFLGAESWRSPDGKKNNATYYWATLDALKEFSSHPRHLEAKRQYSRWYDGFHIVISEVIRSYGDCAFSHITPNERSKCA